MSRMMKIGNLNEFDALADEGAFRPGRGGGALRSLQLGQRIKRLTGQALDKGETQVRRKLDEIVPLDDELDPEEQEALAEGLDICMGALRNARGPGSSRARAAIAGLYDALSGAGGHDEDDEDDDHFGGVDAIGLQPHEQAGGLMPHRKDEWR